MMLIRCHCCCLLLVVVVAVPVCKGNSIFPTVFSSICSISNPTGKRPMSRMEAMVESESESLRTISNAVADETFVNVAAPRIHEYPSLPRVAVEVELPS